MIPVEGTRDRSPVGMPRDLTGEKAVCHEGRRGLVCGNPPPLPRGRASADFGTEVGRECLLGRAYSANIDYMRNLVLAGAELCEGDRRSKGWLSGLNEIQYAKGIRWDFYPKDLSARSGKSASLSDTSFKWG